MALPKGVKKYFWDTDVSGLDVKIHKKYIVGRILELGDGQAVDWMKKIFTKKDISEVVRTSKQLSKKSFNFWNLIVSR